MKLIILTAESKNFVPVELLKAAQARGIEASIVDISKIVIDESPSTAGANGLWLIHDGDEPQLSQLQIDADTVVIPRLNEHHLDTKINILKKMEHYGATLINSAEGMELCNDKLMSQLVLNRLDIETPRSWVIQDPSCFDFVVDQLDERGALTFPLIVKTFRGTHGIGVMKLDSKSSLVSVGQTLLKEGLDFMLQEFIKHEQSCRIIMKGAELLAANLRGQPKDKDEFRTNSHLGSETQPYVPPEDELKLAQQVVNAFGVNFCAIDYIVIDTVTKGDELPATEGLKTGHIHVMGEQALRWNAASRRWWRISLTEEETQKVVQAQLAEGKRIIVLEVNGSPGLEAMSKNWPDRNLAAEVVEFSSTLLQAKQEENAPKLTQAEADQAEADQAEAVPAEVKPASETPPPANGDEGAVTADEVDEPHKTGTLALIEQIIIHHVIDTPIEGKVDTGARTSSLHVDDIEVTGDMVRFRRGEVTFRVPLSDTRHVKSHDNRDSSSARPIVKLDATVQGIRANGVEFSLIDRGHMQYQVLIGRNLIAALGLPIAIEPAKPDQAEPSESDIKVDGEEE